ncbi:Cyclic nucleotide-binding protein [Flavobacterium sp. 9AF]|uniref:Crp/Fnr family transcriptional regulator n=1 Tax=Flavobacterium sp. 9AF TaxID=2653142 RepID=UPI0012F12B99|nr:Crp/Fnr family transcriptional regulator [Flavobacterium sp. 9AF]VXC35878.1 Cyclic nucleotide-binding protein [Flavobacterium sp. 9AF]
MYKLLRETIEKEIKLTDLEWKKILDKIELVKLDKNNFFLSQDNACNYEGFVLKGSLKIYTLEESGSENIAFFAFEGDWVCDIEGFYNKKKSKYNIKSLEICDIVVVSRENKEWLFKEIPKLLHFHSLMMQKVAIVMQNRLLETLNKTAKERYLNFITKHPDKIYKINNRNLSSYLGVSEEFLSKIKKLI